MKFRYFQPSYINFGVDEIKKIGEIVSRYGNKCMLVTTSNEEKVMEPLYTSIKNILKESNIKVFHFDKAIPNPTIEIVEKGIVFANENSIDVILAVGGGSSIDTGKAIGLLYDVEKIDWEDLFNNYTDPFGRYEKLSKLPIPIIAVPTTAGTGSELTQCMVISDPENNNKMSVFHHDIFPKEAVVDPQLMTTLPPYLTATTGFDAFTHAFESYLNKNASPYTKLLCENAMELIYNNLVPLMDDLENIEYRENMALAEMYAGMGLANAGASIPHPLSEIIGGISKGVSHGQCLACVYPSFLEYIKDIEVEKCGKIAKTLNKDLENKTDKEAADKLPEIIKEFLIKVDIYKPLKNLGVTEEEFEEIKSHFLLDVLPFAPKDVYIKILNDAYGGV